MQLWVQIVRTQQVKLENLRRYVVVDAGIFLCSFQMFEMMVLLRMFSLQVSFFNVRYLFSSSGVHLFFPLSLTRRKLCSMCNSRKYIL